MSLVKITWVVVISLLLAGCTSVTKLSVHRDAAVYLHDSNRVLGHGEVFYQDSKPVWGTTTFRIEAPGCNPKLLTIFRSDDISFWRVVGGFIVIIPWFWAGDYEKSYGVVLDCHKGGVPVETSGKD